MQKRSFLMRDTRRVARDLLGIELIRKVGRTTLHAVITETEAYCGPHDKACHASRGRTARTEVMYSPAGTLYVYLIYGMHYCLNIVTESEDYPAAVLIRGIDIEGLGLVNGPGRMTKALCIDKSLNGKSIFDHASGLSLGKRTVRPSKIITTPRIGVDYAGSWAQKPWRYLIQ